MPKIASSRIPSKNLFFFVITSHLENAFCIQNIQEIDTMELQLKCIQWNIFYPFHWSTLSTFYRKVLITFCVKGHLLWRSRDRKIILFGEGLFSVNGQCNFYSWFIKAVKTAWKMYPKRTKESSERTGKSRKRRFHGNRFTQAKETENC